MAEKKKNVRSTNNQIIRLVDYMSTHLEFARGDFTGPLGQKKIDEEWAKLKALLAECGPDKSIEQWKNTWRDLKKKARNETATQKQQQIATGNTEPVSVLSDITNKIINIIGLASAIGIGPSESNIDRGNSSREEVEVESLPMSSASTSILSAPSTSAAPLTSASNGSKKKRKQSRPVTDFANIQKEANEILNKCAENLITVLKERNEVEKERNKIAKERNQIEKERNAILKYSAKRGRR